VTRPFPSPLSSILQQSFSEHILQPFRQFLEEMSSESLLDFTFKSRKFYIIIQKVTDLVEVYHVVNRIFNAAQKGDTLMPKVAFDILNDFADQCLQIVSINNQAFQNNTDFFIQRV
jgi:hypothetical protein